MKCATCRELMVAYIKVQLDDGQVSQFEEHIAQCTDCQAELEGARKVAAVADQASDEPIERIANTMLERAIQLRASDIHIQPKSERMVIRYRIDGVLQDIMVLPRYVLDPLVARIKIMAGMSVSEKRMPQDGRMHLRHEDKDYDLRVSVVPSLLGEMVVMRVLDKGALMLDLSDIFTDENTRGQVEELLNMPAGLVCCTGPTGSGKTTTLYAMLQHLNRRENNVLSVEDPVEFQIDGVTQIRVDQQAGLNFSTAMRHILRQDPDVILCGEIRDMNTLQTVIQAAMTGHLVLTTLHTNDAIGAIRRMIDVAGDRFLISSSLTGVLAQRLLRKVCPDCATERAPTAEESAWLQAAGVIDPPAKLAVGEGCGKCRGKGVRGRVAVHEVLVIDPALRDAIAGDMDIREIEALAAGKFEPMRNDAARRVLAGEVDIAEAMRVLAFMPGYE